MASKAISRRVFLKGLGAAGLSALCSGGLLSEMGCTGPAATVLSPDEAASGTQPAGSEPAYLREAMFYTSFGESALNCGECHEPQPSRVLYCHTRHGSDFVKCQLCPRGCIISEGQRGECGVRENRGGRLYTVVYGRVCALNLDPIEKKPFYHFLPGSPAFSLATAGCNLHCLYCQNWSISQSRPEEVDSTDLPPQAVVSMARRYGSQSIAYTYSEPIVFYEYMLETAWQARLNGLRNVVISAGYISPEPLRRLCGAVDAIKIDLKGFNEAFYREICDGELEPVLQTLKTIREAGTHLEVVNLVVPTLNDDPEELRELCRWVVRELGPDVPLHFSRFHPQYRLNSLPATPVESLEQARQVALEAGVKYAYVGNVPGHEGNNTFCPSCGEVVIGRQGYSIVSYHLVDGSCQFCGEPVAGVWGQRNATIGR